MGLVISPVLQDFFFAGRLRAGGRELGYLYNFAHRGIVHAYRSGFRHDPDPRLKPGLVGHSLAVERSRGLTSRAGGRPTRARRDRDPPCLFALSIQRR